MTEGVESIVNRLVRPEVKALTSYHVQPADGMIKLDAMENPYRWPPESHSALWLAFLRQAQVNRYPDPGAVRLAKKVRSYYGVPETLSVLFGNGSDELIQIMGLCLARPGSTILAPEPGFVMYRMIARFAGMDYVGVPLNESFGLDVQEMVRAIKQYNPAIVFLAQPNNPTGNVFDREDTLAIIRESEGLVVIDEAYLPFTGANHLSLASEYDNVVVMRTFSKMGLAGLRLGVLIGAPHWLEEFEKVRLPYNINVLSQLSAEFALTHVDILESQTEMIRAERARLDQALRSLPLERVYPSEANFILIRLLKTHDARDVFEAMKRAGVLVKCMDGAHPLLENCLRLTIGTPEENEAMVDALGKALE